MPLAFAAIMRLCAKSPLSIQLCGFSLRSILTMSPTGAPKNEKFFSVWLACATERRRAAPAALATASTLERCAPRHTRHTRASADRDRA